MAPKGAPKKETKAEAEPKETAKKKHAEAAEGAEAHAKGHEKKPKEHEEKPHAAAHAPFHSKSLSREDSHCKIKGCKRSYKAKGYCQPHYREWRNGKFGKARFDACGEFNCFRPMATNRHGMCEEHYVERYVKGIAAAKPAAPKKEEKEEAKESA